MSCFRGKSPADGVAMVIAMMALLLITALGAALILTSSSETIIAGHFRDSLEAQYAADAMIARALGEIAGVSDWNVLTDGSTHSAWVDGPASGVRTLVDGSTIDLGQVVNTANCQKLTACSAADLSATTVDRPWGANNPRWIAYAYGPLRGMLPAPRIDSPYYVVWLTANAPAAIAGSDLVAVRAEAFGPHGAHKVVEVTVSRAGRGAGDEKDYNDGLGQALVSVLSWREVR